MTTSISSPLFSASFAEAYSLRNTFSTIKSAVGKVYIIWTPNDITISETNKNKTAMFNLVIKKTELKDYQYDALDEDGTLLPCIGTGVDMAEMVKATKSIKRNDGAVIFMEAGDARLHIQLIRAKSKDGSRTTTNFVPIEEVDHTEYASIEYSRGPDDPNTKITASEFSSTCTTMVSMKCNYVEVISYPRGIQFRGINASKSVLTIETFGTCILENTPSSSDTSKNKQYIIRIPISTIKALGKVNNLSINTAMIKFFSENNKPLKIVCPIGVYGSLSISIRDTEC